MLKDRIADGNRASIMSVARITLDLSERSTPPQTVVFNSSTLAALANQSWYCYHICAALSSFGLVSPSPSNSSVALLLQ